MLRKKIITLSIIIILFFTITGCFSKKDNGKIKKLEDPNKKLSSKTIEDCFNSEGISGGLIVGYCQKTLCGDNNSVCKTQVTETFNEMISRSSVK